MPLNIVGKIRFAGIQDIGPLGPAEASEVVYYWPPYLHVAGLAMPLALAVLLLRAPNRSRRSWWAFCTIFVLVVAWIGEQSGVVQFQTFLDGVGRYYPNITIRAFAQPLRIPTYAIAEIFYTTTLMVMFAGAFLLLLLDTLAGLSGIAAAVYALLILAFAGAIGMFGVFAHRGEPLLLPIGIAYGALMCAMLAALILARFFCRRNITTRRYCVWFFVILWPSMCVTLIGITIMAALMNIIYGFRHLSEVIASALLWGLGVCLLLLPVLVSALRDPRFLEVMRMPELEHKKVDAYNKGKEEGENE